MNTFFIDVCTPNQTSINPVVNGFTYKILLHFSVIPYNVIIIKSNVRPVRNS